MPTKFPEKGFYYHFKHDPKGPVNKYAYELVGVGRHTEDDCRPEDTYLAIYRPLYEEARAYKEGKIFDARPLAMFTEMVTRDGKTFPRFQKISDADVIAELQTVGRKMYG